MFKLIFYIIITYSFAFSQWVEEGDYYKLNHDMGELKELRYSIDTTHIILINDEKISYYNKYSGEFSKSFSVPVISEMNDTLYHFVNPRLSLNEKILSYNNEGFSGANGLINSEIVLIDLETHEFIRIDERNDKGGYPTSSPTNETFVFFESIDNNLYYHNYIASIPKQAGVAQLELRNHLESASSIRIESMYPHVKFNPKNKTIAVQNIKYKNKLILIDADSNIILGRGDAAYFDFETSGYTSAHYKYFEVDDL